MNAPARLEPEGLVDTRLIAPGIRCAACIGKIERELPKLQGIASARVNLSAKRVLVRHGPGLGEPELVEAMRVIGFEAQPVRTGLTSEDAESRALLRALAVAGFGMMNIMLLSVSVWSGASGATREMFHWLSAVIAVPVIAYAGRPFFGSAWRALRAGRTNMDVPISIGVTLATCLSLYETLTWGEQAYFDGAVMLLFFLLAGRALDAAMRGRTRAEIGALLSKMGRSASVLKPDGSAHRVAADSLEPGMLMLVAAGEALAADGVVELGAGAIDNAMLTGESMPERVGAGDAVHAGAINLTGPLQIRITAAASETTIAHIAQLMDEAGLSRNRYVRIADRVSRLYAPAVHSLAAMAFAGWMLAGAGWHQSLVVAIAVLIITCPCAMGLAVPAAQVVAAGALGKRGLLVKDGGALERLAEVDLAIFDKTGTLTLGEPRPELQGLTDRSKSIALALAQTSRHPLSRGIAAGLFAEGTIPAAVTQIAEAPGHGITGLLDGDRVALAPSDENDGRIACDLIVGEKRVTIRFTDQLRPDVLETLAAVQAMGIECRMISGDRTEAVAAMSARLGIPGIGAATPETKLDLLEALKAEGRRPLMVGDGLNDGPALAAAHASIAPGTASDLSQQAADAVSVGERLMPVALALRASRRTMAIVRQNFAVAIVYNICAVPLAIAGVVTPLIAAVAMSASSLIVIGNSLRLAGAAK
ncbi:MAG: heavy metal translocating P-type ATPase [Novosphingobium sp.]